MQRAELIGVLDRFLERVRMTRRERVLRPTVATMEKAVSQAFRTQGRRLIEESRVLEGARGEGRGAAGVVLREAWTIEDWLRLFDLVSGETVDLFFTPIQAGVAEALLAGASEVIGMINVDYAFGLANPRAVAYLEAHGYGLISQIDSVTRGNIATIVNNGTAEGWSYNRVAREISSLYSEMAIGKPQQHIDSRAHLIAVTEAGNGYEEGNLTVVRDLEDAGLRMEKKWLTVGDDRVSDGCQANQDEGWIPVAQAFQSGHARPLRFPGCRCTTEYRRRPNGRPNA
jgi:hypothetical protein